MDSPNDRDLCLSVMLHNNAVAYDWMYGFLSVEERAKILKTLAERTQALYEASTSPVCGDMKIWWFKEYTQKTRFQKELS